MSSASGPSKKRAGPDSPASSGPSGTVRSQTVAEIFETSIHAEDFEACVRLLEEDHSPSTWTDSSHEWIQEECVNEAMSSEYSLAPNRKNCRMFDTALEILSAEYASISAGYRLENAIDACALAVQTICVSLLTACEAHIRAVRPFFLDRPLTEIFLLGINGAISQSLRLRFHLGDLACFGNMLGRSVMALDSTRCETSVDDYRLVSMPIEHITELWGPSDVIRDQFDPSITYAIRIGGGIIYRPLEDSSVLHWEPWSLRDVAERNPLDISDWLTVGDLTSIKRDCPLVRGPQDTILRSSLRTEVHELGTWTESWTLQQIQTGLQAGQYVNATFNATWIKSASRTRKEKGLAELGLDFLDQPWGLL
ncbi:hypothetical protein D6C78_11008, partial [Aureobasidium pullulans]